MTKLEQVSPLHSKLCTMLSLMRKSKYKSM